MSKRIIYICSPLRGDHIQNLIKAARYCRNAAMNYTDVIPIAPHVYFTEFLNDCRPSERSLGMEMGLELLEMCDELWVYGLDNPSEGMKAEIEQAKARGMTIRDGFDIDNRGMERPFGVEPIPLEELDKMPEVFAAQTSGEHYEDMCAELLHNIHKFNQKHIKLLQKEGRHIDRKEAAES